MQRTSGGIKEARNDSFKCLSESGSRMDDDTVRDQTFPSVASAAFLKDENDGSSSWHFVRGKEFGYSISWYDDSRATRHIGNTQE